MKLKYIILSFAAIALLAGCSKSRTEVQQPDPAVDPDSDAWVNDESLPVPVNFASPSIGVDSKAQINDIADLGPVGILGLDKNGGWGTEENDEVLIYNKQAVRSQEEGSWILKFNPAVYYPMHNNNNYTFYGYHPYKDDMQYVYQRRYEVTYDIGHTDIIWAKSEAVPFDNGEVHYDGFNGRYVRAVRNNLGTGTPGVSEPHFEFSHLLTALSFNVVSASGENLETVRVRAIEVTTFTQGTLLVADSQDSENWEGKVNPVSGSTGSVKVTGGHSDTGDYRILPETSPTTVGEAIMLIPADTYDMKLYMTVNDHEVDPSEYTVIDAVISRDGGFEPGKQYNLTVNVYSPEEIKISIELTPWDTVEDTPPIEIG